MISPNSRILLFYLHFVLAHFVNCAFVFEAHRLIQFDRFGDHFGSTRTMVNHLAASIHSVGDLSRRIIVVSISELSSEALKNLVDERKAAGLLILLPQDLSLISTDIIQKWRGLEKYLLSRAFDLSIYFAYIDEKLEEIVDILEKSVDNSNCDQYQLSTTSAHEAQAVKKPTIYNFQGMFRGFQQKSSTRTIMIVANYDTFGASPSLSVGSDLNGSGMVALLELVRIFRRLYDDTVRSQSGFNLLFLLTGGSAMLNFAGTSHWLSSVDSNLLNTIDFVLCLDSLGSSNDLFLHVSRPPKTDKIKKLYQNFEDTASVLNISLSVSQRKINISNPDFGFQHELFSRHKFVAATLSSRSSSNDDRGSIFDRRNSTSDEILSKNVRFLAETISRQIYELQSFSSLEVVADEHSMNLNAISAWNDFLSQQPRVSLFMERNNPVIKNLEKFLSSSTTGFSISKIELQSSHSKTSVDDDENRLPMDFNIYRSPNIDPLKHISITAYKVKPFEFDIFLSLAIVFYLIVIQVATKAPKSLKELKAIFV